MIFIALMTGTICYAGFEQYFAGKYYTSNKQNVLLTAYHNINEATSKGNTNSDTFKIEVQKLCGIYNISILIVNADSDIVTSSVHETTALTHELMGHILALWIRMVADRMKSCSRRIPIRYRTIRIIRQELIISKCGEFLIMAIRSLSVRRWKVFMTALRFPIVLWYMLGCCQSCSADSLSGGSAENYGSDLAACFYFQKDVRSGF